MTFPIWQVNAFTDRPWAGNPAAVVLLPEPREVEWMQAVAREMNLSETAFLVPRPGAGEGAELDLRWFTPAVEVELCGHATLASAHVLWESGRLPPGTIRFHTAGGELTAERREGWIELDFPAEPAAPSPADAPAVTAALGVTPRYVGRNRFDLLAELADAGEVRGLAPDLERLARLPARGVIVTAAADSPGHDFVSRFFAPQCGVPEDPVTGSAHCCLGPFWAERLGAGELAGFQASARGGTVRVRLGEDRSRVLLGGRAVTVWGGQLFC